jgi:acyl-CoA synthetase (AMP-forming)/AMP-acid ligase II
VFILQTLQCPILNDLSPNRYLVNAAAIGAGGLALAAYLDAKHLIRHDLSSSSIGEKEKAMAYITDRVKEDKLLLYHKFQEQATGNNANTIFLMFEGKQWTYREFYDCIHRVGNWLMNDLGVQKNEIVALDGGNSPEFIMLWLGLDSIGAVPAFINCNLTAQPLLHCIKIAEARYLLADQDVRPLVAPYESELQALNIQTIYYTPSSIGSLSDTTPIPTYRNTGLDPLSLRQLIYTSGTTGLPKATVLWTSRTLNTGRMVNSYLKLKPGHDRMYTCMPMYHGAALGLCASPTIHAGTTVVLGRKFSHKTFWPEVSTSKATVIQYVGELCRYLLNAPPHPLERKHNVKMVWGNGMRPDVWEAFRQRFGIEVINELYAATDGVGISFNYNRGAFGANAIAKRGLLWKLFNRGEVRVKIDVDTEEMYRDPKTGFAQKTALGEPGEAIHKQDPAAPSLAFQGYHRNKEAGEKRFIKDVFEKGDLYFRSGDLMRQEHDGCVYFVDRLGDTFRWKSENVSTNEVAAVVGTWSQIAEANVYGVTVPHSDGRAGCAAVILRDGVTVDSLDRKGLASHLIGTLPRYAVPIFIRVTGNMEYTGTMKLQKGKLKAEGADPEKTGGDVVFWLPMGGTEYVKFRKADWDRLGNRSLRL